MQRPTMIKILSAIIVCYVIGNVGAQAGRKFLVAFPPEYRLSLDGFCHMIFNVKATAEVTIHFHSNTDNLSLDAGSHTYDIDCGIRAPLGFGNNAVLVESSVDISVQVYNDRQLRGDAYLALPSTNGEAEYILATPPQPCIGASVSSVYTIAAELDNTEVHLYMPGPEGYLRIDTIYLDKLQTYSNTTAPSTDEDYTGWKVSSNHPISLISGSSCYIVDVGTCSTGQNAGYIFAPPTDQAGYLFIVPRITSTNPRDSGTYIRVISFSQGNMIELPDHSIHANLNTGEYYEYYISNWNQTTRVECWEQCVVIMYNEAGCSSGSFMMYVTPLDKMTNYGIFSAFERMEASGDRFLENFVTVIAETQNILLDGEPVNGWTEVSDWMNYDVILPIEHGNHTLESGDGGNFVAFVYGHYSTWGYGSAIVHGDSSSPPSTTVPPTTDTTELPGQIPTYRISLVSDWTSVETMETNCLTQYTNQLRQKTLQVAVVLNDVIDETVCAGFTSADISVTSASSSFFSSTDSGNAFVWFTISPASNVPLSDVINCAQEIAEYAKPHSIWGEPLLDQIQDCADPVFEDGVFYDGNHQWICLNEKESEEYSSVPSYYIELEDVGKTHDDSDLTPECSFRYGGSLDERGSAMRSQLDSMIGSELCPGMNGINVASYLTSFTAQGSNALIHIDFILTFEDSVNSRDVLVCSEEVREYVMMYTNWGLPLLPPEGGCPDITFQDNGFDDTKSGWICNV